MSKQSTNNYQKFCYKYENIESHLILFLLIVLIMNYTQGRSYTKRSNPFIDQIYQLLSPEPVLKSSEQFARLLHGNYTEFIPTYMFKGGKALIEVKGNDFNEEAAAKLALIIAHGTTNIISCPFKTFNSPSSLTFDCPFFPDDYSETAKTFISIHDSVATRFEKPMTIKPSPRIDSIKNIKQPATARCLIKIYGANFDSIFNPAILITEESSVIHKSSCTYKRKLMCPAPAIPSFSESPKAINLPLSILSHSFPIDTKNFQLIPEISYHADPKVIVHWTEETKLIIIIQQAFVSDCLPNVVFMSRDGTMNNCSIEVYSEDKIECIIPERIINESKPNISDNETTTESPSQTKSDNFRWIFHLIWGQKIYYIGQINLLGKTEKPGVTQVPINVTETVVTQIPLAEQQARSLQRASFIFLATMVVLSLLFIFLNFYGIAWITKSDQKERSDEIKTHSAPPIPIIIARSHHKQRISLRKKSLVFCGRDHHPPNHTPRPSH